MELLVKIHARLTETANGCREWGGKRSTKGYGLIKIGGRWVRVHRLVLEAKVGPLGELQACHRCDNPPCCNEEHLYAGTATDNVRDMVRRGRARMVPPQVDKPNAKVRREDVSVIRQRWRAGETQTEIGREFGITGAAVSLIVRGLSWPDVTGAVGGEEARMIALTRDGGARNPLNRRRSN